MNEAKSRQLGELLIELMKEMQADGERWFPETSHDLFFNALALGGEVGEFQNVVKKVLRGSLDLKDASTRMQLNMEWTDAFIYLMNCGALLQINPVMAYNYVRGENGKRFGNHG